MKAIVIGLTRIKTVVPLSVSIIIAMLIGYAVAMDMEIATNLFFLLLLLSAATTVSRKIRTAAVYVGIFCLPFIQVPTVKWVLRWRITEVISWVVSPKNLQNLLQRYHRLPGIVRLYIAAMILYFLYTFTVGVTMALMSEVVAREAVEASDHLLFRTLLESARVFAGVSLIGGVLYMVNSHQDLEKLLGLFVSGGAISGLYGLYQASIIQFGLQLPLLPGTLGLEGYARPFSTFYEPTGLGSYTAASTLLALYLVRTSKGCRRAIWLLVLLANALGLLVSLSRAGLVGIGLGALVLAAVFVIQMKPWSLIRSWWTLGVILVPVYLTIRYVAPNFVNLHLSRLWFEQSVKMRQETYQQLLSFLVEHPLGVGQGVFLFIGGGAPGFFRLIVEGGVLGTILLAVMHFSSLLCLRALLLSKISYIRTISPYIAASYTSAIVTTLIYINTSDIWIWFIWSLPAIAVKLQKTILESGVAELSD